MAARNQRKSAEIKFNQSLNETPTPDAPAAKTSNPEKPKPAPADELMPGAARARVEAEAPMHPRAELDQEIQRQRLKQNTPENIEKLKRKNELLDGANSSREQGEDAPKVSRYSDADRREHADRAGIRAEAERQASLDRYNEAPISEAETKKAAKKRAVKPRNSRR